MKTNLLLTILFALFMSAVNAQDIIIKKNGDEIQAKVLEVTGSGIIYKRSDNMDGPTYTIDKADVFMLKHANGTKEIISPMNAPDAGEREKKLANANRIFQEQKSYLTAGYGFGTFLFISNNGSWYGGNGYYDENNNGTLTGPFYFKYEYGVTEILGIGINVAYMEYTFTEIENYYPNTYFYTHDYTSFSGLIRANWHFGISDKIDPYYGFGLGYRSGAWKTTTNNPYGTYEDYYANFPFGFETTFGIRIKLTQNLGLYAEAGIAKSAVQVGMSVKF